MMASDGGHVGCLQLLLDRGAQANCQDWVSAVLDVHVYVLVNVYSNHSKWLQVPIKIGNVTWCYHYIY